MCITFFPRLWHGICAPALTAKDAKGAKGGLGKEEPGNRPLDHARAALSKVEGRNPARPKVPAAGTFGAGRAPLKEQGETGRGKARNPEGSGRPRGGEEKTNDEQGMMNRGTVKRTEDGRDPSARFARSHRFRFASLKAGRAGYGGQALDLEPWTLDCRCETKEKSRGDRPQRKRGTPVSRIKS